MSPSRSLERQRLNFGPVDMLPMPVSRLALHRSIRNTNACDIALNHIDDIFGSAVERLAFSHLLSSVESLGLRSVHQCRGYFADGYVVGLDGLHTPIEVKTTLGWAQLTNASFQLVGMVSKLGMQNVKRGCILYTKISSEWQRSKQDPVQHAYDCLSHFQVGIDFGLIEVTSSGLIMQANRHRMPDRRG